MKNILSIIISNCDTPHWTNLCVNSAKKETQTQNEIILIDNGSKDFSKSIIKHSNYDIIIENKKNMGISYSWNQGIEASASKYICFVHSDCILTSGWEIPLIKHLEENENSAIACSFTNYSGNAFVRISDEFLNRYVKLKLPNKSTQTEQQIKELINSFYSETLNQFQIENFNKYQHSYRFLTSLPTHCFMVRRNIFEQIGKFDERFFPYFGFEELFIKNIFKQKKEVVACLGSFIHHNGNTTSDGVNFCLNKLLNDSKELLKNINYSSDPISTSKSLTKSKTF